MTGRNSSQRNVKGPSRLIAQVTPRSSAVKPTKSSTDDAEALANAAAKKVAAAREKKAAEKEAKDKAAKDKATKKRSATPVLSSDDDDKATSVAGTPTKLNLGKSPNKTVDIGKKATKAKAKDLTASDFQTMLMSAMRDLKDNASSTEEVQEQVSFTRDAEESTRVLADLAAAQVVLGAECQVGSDSPMLAAMASS